MTGFTALLILVAMSLALTMTYAGYRVLLVIMGKKRADAWTRGKPSEDPAFIVRASHAHLNCVEMLPVYGAIVLVAAAMGKSAVVDALALAFIGLRLAQTTTHLIGVSHWLVFIRASFFVPQVLICFYLIWQLCCPGTA